MIQTDKLEAKLQNGGGPPELHVAVMEKIGEVKKAYAAIGTGGPDAIPTLPDIRADAVV